MQCHSHMCKRGKCLFSSLLIFETKLEKLDTNVQGVQKRNWAVVIKILMQHILIIYELSLQSTPPPSQYTLAFDPATHRSTW